MARLPILRYPDPRLHTVAQPVAAVDDTVRALIPRMLATMYEANGIGLAMRGGCVHHLICRGRPESAIIFA